ncbi:hypothetical protein DV736_g3678, partial [Chaetothyriales sp. CBS 134916]
MASTEPWISPLLRLALELFIAGKYESNQFSFDYDSSSKRLEIKARLTEARTLRVVELPIAQGRLEPLGSDGAYALPFTGDDSCGRLQTGQVLLAREIEFIVGDHFDPVRVEICPRSLEVVGHSNAAMQTCSLPLRMSQEATMQALLQDALRVSGQEPKAVSGDGDREEILSQVEGSVVSQAAFQTQAPLPFPMAAATKPKQVKRAVLLSTAEQRQKDTALNLLRPKDRDGRPLPVSEAERSSARIQLVRQPVVHSEEKATPDPVSPSSVLSQRPLCSLTNSVPEVSIPRSDIIAGPGPAKSPTKPVSMPSGLQRWSKERVANRYLPRYISKISESQSALLNSDNSYYPPLPGRDLRPGTIPFDLLNKIIAQADRLTMAPEDSCVQPGESAEPGKQREEASEEEGNGEEGNGEEEVLDQLALVDSSQSVRSDDWPDSSPERRRTELPPDSRSNTPSELSESQSEHSFVAEAAPSSPVPEMIEASLNQSVAPKLSGSQAHTITRSEVSQSRDETNGVSDDSAALISSGHQQAFAVSPTKQIKRTSHLERTIHLADALASNHGPSEQLSSSSHELIHSTYDCIALEHPVLHENEPNAPASSPRSSKSLAAMNIPRAVKRPAHDGMQELREAKRFKISSKGRGPDAVDPAYNEVIEANRARRTAELAALTEKRPGSQRLSSSSATSDVAHPRNISVATKSGTDLSTRPSRSDLAGGSSTPVTVPSHPSNTTVSPLTSSEFVPKTLFDRYRSVYQDYEGDEPGFENAVALLKRVRDDNTGPHPFLFDDFIFHHYHSYRDYLVKVASSSEDPLPYGRYYDLYIQSPGHSQNVVTLATLTWPSSHPGLLPRERPYVRVERIGFAQSSENLVGVQKLARKHVSSQHGSPQPHLHDDIDDMQTEQRTDQAMQQNRVAPLQQSSVQSWVEQIRGASPELGAPDIDRSRDDVRPAAPTTLHISLEKIAHSKATASPCSSLPTRTSSKRMTSAPHQMMQRREPAAGTEVPISTPTDKQSKPKQPGWWNKGSASPFSNLTPRSDPPHGSQGESKPRFTDFYKWRRL